MQFPFARRGESDGAGVSLSSAYPFFRIIAKFLCAVHPADCKVVTLRPQSRWEDPARSRNLPGCLTTPFHDYEEQTLVLKRSTIFPTPFFFPCALQLAYTSGLLTFYLPALNSCRDSPRVIPAIFFHSLSPPLTFSACLFDGSLFLGDSLRSSTSSPLRLGFPRSCERSPVFSVFCPAFPESCSTLFPVLHASNAGQIRLRAERAFAG